jgi:dienelactone hydrolase
MVKTLGGVLVIAATLAGCAADLATIQRRLEPHDRAQRPSGPGPFPAVLLVPGCGGITPARVKAADELVSRGYAVAFVDYQSARGLQTACRGEASPEDVARDIHAVATHMRSQSHVRPGALGVVGWSLGGAGVLANLAASAPEQPSPFQAAAAFYPPCEPLRHVKSQVPLLLVLAGADDIAPPAPCQDLVRRAGLGHSIVVRVYPDARHSFDMSDLAASQPARSFPGKTVGYHAEATRQAWAEVFALFDRRLEGRK